ncbi:hypothetical protein RS030_142103 [Cryptosporidium xiaoi]|uniref:AATF leucine zipper-containing domain-containing protein n=1 Tax=Cryptosporidium xiaoi TaxID=659607 RepID=A0AAV9Y357_9CRYT
MRDLLTQAPEAHSLEKKQAFISISELEQEVQKFSTLLNKKRTILIQSGSKLKNHSEDDSDDEKDAEGDDNTTEEEAEQMLRDLTNKIWKTTEQILHAHTGISGLVGAIPPQIIK